VDQVTQLSPDHFYFFYYYYFLFQALFLVMLVVEETVRNATHVLLLPVRFVIIAEQRCNDCDDVSSSVLFVPKL
jgi:hypothetical protein